MQGKIAIIGSDDFVMPYSTLGADCFVVDDNNQQIVSTAQQIVDEKYALVVVAEPIANITNQVFEQFNKTAVPCVLVVPFTNESEGFAIDNLSKLLKAATGIDILQNS